jgi:putative hemolysin
MPSRRSSSARTGAGSLPADLLADRLGVALPEARGYATAAGFALSVLRRLPTVGEVFTFDGWRFEVVDMDGRKIDKLLASELGSKAG